ncbi:MAG: NTP transferase domain-containing protein [Bacillota bacterium]
MSVDAVVLAGRANDGKLRDADPAEWEALIEVAGKPMLQYVLDALDRSRLVDRIVVVAPPGVERCVTSRKAGFVSPGGSMVENVMRGFETLGGDGRALVATSDIPLVTAEVVDGFIGECGAVDLDFYYPVVRQDVMEARYPGVRRTYAGMREGRFTGGNMFLVDVRIADKLRKTLEFLVENRKKPLRMAAVLGVPFLLKMVLKRLSIPEAERKAGSLYGLKAKAVVTAFPEIGFDVDKPSDLGLCRSVLDESQ